MKNQFLFFILLMLSVGCKEDVALRDWVIKVDTLRQKTIEAMSQTPYQLEQHQNFRNYFGEIEQLTLQIVQNKNYVAAFNRAVSKTDLKETCSRVFLDHQDWQFIVDHCTKNGLFICSEEVRVYTEMVAKIRQNLVPELQKRFDQTPECKDSL